MFRTIISIELTFKECIYKIINKNRRESTKMSLLINKKLCSIIYFLIKKSKFLGKTKLIKLLYLADYEFYKNYNREISGTTVYIKWDYGPYSPDIEECLFDMAGLQIIKIKKRTSLKMRDYYSFNLLGSHDYEKNLDSNELEFMEFILSKYDHLEIEDLKRIAYKTPPMLYAQNKGDLLDFDANNLFISDKLKNLGKKIESLKNYDGPPYDSKYSLGNDELMEYQCELAKEK